MIKRGKSIKFKLVYSIVSVIFLAFISLSYYNYKSSQKAMLDRIVNYELPYYSDKAKLTIYQLLEKGIRNLDIMVNDAYFIDLISNPEGKTDEISTYLQYRVGENEDLKLGFVSDFAQMYYTVNSNPGIIDKENTWYFNFLEQPDDKAFNVNQSSENQEIKLWIQQKVFGANGEILGVAYIGYDIEKVKNFVLSQNFGNKGETIIVGLDGGIKVHPDSAKIDYNNLLKKENLLSSLPGIGSKAEELIKKEDNSIEYIKKNGDARIIISKYIPELKWVMIVDVSKNQILEPLKSLFVKTLIGSLLLTIAIVILIYFLINKIAVQPIKKMSSYINLFTDGDLKVSLDIKRDDEIGEFAILLQKMQEKLSEIVIKIKESSDVINTTSFDLNNNAQNVAASSNQQAASVEQISATMEQILNQVSENKNNSKETEVISYKSHQELTNVYKSVANTSTSMLEIVKKVSVISEIAEKTDMLAINAAIEAARAGEKGKGFSVVAFEIRKLAEKSNDAAIEIEKISQKSVELAQLSTNLLNAVMPDIEKTSNLVKSITKASIEQDASIKEISNAVIQLSQISQKNSAAADNLSSSSTVLSKQGEVLDNNISFFK